MIKQRSRHIICNYSYLQKSFNSVAIIIKVARIISYSLLNTF